MKYCYAFRRFSDYPYLGNAFDMDPERITSKFLRRVKDMGFDGIELGVECLEKINGGVIHLDGSDLYIVSWLCSRQRCCTAS